MQISIRLGALCEESGAVNEKIVGRGCAQCIAERRDRVTRRALHCQLTANFGHARVQRTPEFSSARFAFIADTDRLIEIGTGELKVSEMNKDDRSLSKRGCDIRLYSGYAYRQFRRCC